MGFISARLDTQGSGGRGPHGRTGHGATPPLAFDSAAGRITLATDSPERFVQREGFAAVWSRAVAPLPPGGSEALRHLRAPSLVLATPDGLEIERGPYGGASLYYARHPAGVLVASSLASVIANLAALGTAPPLDVDALAALGVTRIPPDPRATVYRGVRRLLSCERVRFGADGSAHSSFHLPAVPSRLPGTALDHAHAMRELLEAILAEDLRPFAAVGVLAGGGTDSAALLALVARHAAMVGRPRFSGLTMDFAAPGDDRPHMRVLLAHLGASAIRARPEEVGTLPPGFFAQDAAPFTWPTGPLRQLLRDRAHAWGAEAVVTGSVGDLVLDGDLRSFASRVRRGDLRAVWEAARLRLPWSSSPVSRVTDLVVRPLARSWVPSQWLSRHRTRWQERQEVSRWAGPRLKPLLSEPTNPELAGDWLTAFATDPGMMDVADGVGQDEVAWGLPFINPYLDARFIELVGSFPPEELFHGGWMRGLFRVAMEGALPDSIRFRTDKSSFEPMMDETLVALGGVEALAPLLTMEATAGLGLVEPRAFRETFGRVARGAPTPRGWLEVWPMLAVEGFLRPDALSRGSASRAWAA